MFSLYFLLGFGSPPRCPRVGRALCPKGLLSVALASLVTEQIIQLRWCLGWPLSAGLSWHAEIPRCCFVLCCLSFAAGLFSFQECFPCPVVLLFMNRKRQLLNFCGIL